MSGGSHSKCLQGAGTCTCIFGLFSLHSEFYTFVRRGSLVCLVFRFYYESTFVRHGSLVCLVFRFY